VIFGFALKDFDWIRLCESGQSGETAIKTLCMHGTS